MEREVAKQLAQRLNREHPEQGLTIETDLSPDKLRAKLKEWEPWSVLIDFSNGVSTAEFEKRSHFNVDPLYKLRQMEAYVPFENFETVLDIGCNVGYNSIYLAQEYGLRPIGIDVEQRLLDSATFLSSLVGVDGEFVIGHADSFVHACDVVVHLGTLYHVQNPLRSLQSAYESLCDGGYLVLETQTYDSDDERLCYFIHGLNNDPSNFFALSTSTIHTCLSMLGFEIQECYRMKGSALDGDEMFRVGMVARKTKKAAAWPLWA